ncbi:MAG TPA: endonuclease Q family protein, partial [Chitinispirillaceae bacterium]|nr:endonuclease Q family protein [Chitinispirillaceae bacterium]
MKFIADLHIHSRYSLATSSQLTPEMLDLWGRKKGISVVGTGDAVHPGWLDELKTKLVSAENGLFRLKKNLVQDDADRYGNPVNFMLCSEISCIYKKNDRVRKVHNLIYAPSFSSMDKIQKALAKIGNIGSDGRPILGLDSRNLLEIILDADSQAVLIPAHIWTPWFSVLGSKSGFDSIEQCYGDLSKYIFAIETGLSSDPAMNRRCSILDSYALVSNSDAHSPENLGREANLFDTEISYLAIMDALRKRNKKFIGTVEYFPEEGKYHLDGHRKCQICWEPEETKKHNEICPVCGKKVTVGVLSRVMELADTPENCKTDEKQTWFSTTPLKNVLSEVLKSGSQSKKVSALYESILLQCGSEFSILLDTPIEELRKVNSMVADGIQRLREGKVNLQAGY